MNEQPLIERLKQRLKPEEGFRSFAYRDKLGHLTIGWGFLLEPREAAQRRLTRVLGISETAARYIVNGVLALTEEQGEKLLDYTACCALIDADDIVGPMTWRDLPDDARLALADMCFQLGEREFALFDHMLDAVRGHDWERAAAEMRDSQWHQQTPGRCEELAKLMEGCAAPQPPEAA